MMQFSESFPPLPPPLPHQIIPNKAARRWPGLPSPKLQGSSFGDANCMEQLLVHCANAIETNDATLAQQILWVLNNIAPPDGDSGQRLTCGFLRALISRAARSGSCKLLSDVAVSIPNHKFSIIELAGFVDLTPWHRFGFTAANAAVMEAVEGRSVVHIVDLSLTHCMQIPTLIDSFSTRPEGPPFLKLTVAGATEDFPPMLDLSYEDLGAKLINFARSRNVAMEFRVVPSSSSDGFSSLIDHLKITGAGDNNGEALIVNCQMLLHYIPDSETLGASCVANHVNSHHSPRSMFLKAVRGLNPCTVLLVDEDADFTSENLVTRLRSAYNYLWIPYDTVETFLPRESRQRQWYEADMCWKIENVVAQEGPLRVERLEPKGKWVQRMRGAGFRGVGFSEEAVAEVKSMLDEHAAGWGMKREEQDLVLTWKGHNVVFATAWLPA
ncbi:hypothetical protein SASPL_144835 [Salvia splendens]|uniref:Scarecrow-like protein 32 n=1 Tax=Salvia splendens TaxID=180675 RepID=A0A8X8WG15_SALSN|nr:scarecrow-like protein 32 [Salvia splendens]KAG6394252.1 hypothetical protein SASPL_144835 [Salvia splendens]